MLSCIKTGFYAVTPSGLYLYGDAFVLTDKHDQYNCGYYKEPRMGDDHLLLRITSASSEVPPFLNIALETWDQWFDELRGDDLAADNPNLDEVAMIWRPNSTLIASPGQWRWHSYDGKAN